MPHRRSKSRWPLGVCVYACVVTCVIGCSSAPKQTVDRDSRLSRYTESGREAFQEGDIDEAEKKYHQALIRAWAIDDPYESGTVAYNLAACLTSRSKYGEASDWLVDARVELCRARSSAGNTWLLSAEIAMAEERFADADRFVHYASLACPPCDVDDSYCLCGPSGECSDGACKECCLACLPVIGDKLQDRGDDEDCQEGYAARIELAKARLAAKQYDVGGAAKHLAAACALSQDVCDLSLRADCHDVAALIHDIQAEFLKAGAHRDREVRLLRCVGHYREIPNVLDAAAESYRSAERLDLAVDRMIRSARIHLARGSLQDAWQRVRDAGDLAEYCGCQAVEIRLALTAKMIQQMLTQQSTDDCDRPDDVNPDGAEPDTLPVTELPVPADALLLAPADGDPSADGEGALPTAR